MVATKVLGALRAGGELEDVQVPGAAATLAVGAGAGHVASRAGGDLLTEVVGERVAT